MKKYLFSITSGLLFTTLLFTGCIKNEEAAGVKSMRMAQASLIQAKADNISALILSEVAFNEAVAAIEQAKADIQRAAADKAIAGSEIDIAIMKGEQQSKIDKAITDAKIALTGSKATLEGALRDLEKEIAKTEVENPTLDEYMAKYKLTIAEIESIQNDIIGKQEDISNKQIAILYGGAEQDIKNSLEQAQRDLAKEQDLKARYVAANVDPLTIYGSLNAAEVALEVLEADKIVLAGEIAKAGEKVTAAKNVMDKAADNYSDVADLLDDIESFTSDLGHTSTIEKEILDGLSDDPSVDETTVFKSLVAYDPLILAAQELVTDKQEIRANLQQSLTGVNALHNAYKTALTAKQNARKTALTAYRNAVQAYNVALLAAGGDATASTVTAAETTKNNAETAFNTADTELTTLKNDIAGAAIDFGALAGNAEWDDAFYTWVGNNDEKIEELIETLTVTSIPAAQIVLKDAQDDLAELQAERAVVVGYIAYMQNELGASATSIASLKAAYFTAKDVWVAAKDAEKVKSDEMDTLDDEIAYATAVKDAIDGNYTKITGKLDSIDTAIEVLMLSVDDLEVQVKTADISDVDFLNGQLVVLQLELSHLQEQLTVETSSATVYLELIKAEIGD